MNQFVNTIGSHDAQTWNGAVTHSTSGSYILDYFSKCGTYAGRSQDEVNGDMEKMFAEDEVLALKVLSYMRMVTRQVKIDGENPTEKVQKGQGRKDEFIKALNWMREYRSDLYDKYVVFVPELGSWKDMWYDNGDVSHYAPEDITFNMISYYLMEADGNMNADLIAKYLPQYRTNRKTDRQVRRNEWAKNLATYLELPSDKWMRPYKKLKSNPSYTAHSFQRVMSAKDWDNLDFNKIPGKALYKMLNGSFIEKHGLQDRFQNWLEKKESVPFTGYVYELAKFAKGSFSQRALADKQFQTLLNKAGKLSGNILCALDTSYSMSCQVAPNLTAIDVCLSLGIFFSKMNTGEFADHVVMFDSKSSWLKLAGTFSQRMRQIMGTATAWGSTNFQSVVDLIVDKRRRNPHIPVEDYPETILVVSDMQFNPSGRDTNYETAVRKFESVGLPVPNMVWWFVNPYAKDVPVRMNDKGNTLISGFDPSVLSVILDKEVRQGEKVKLDPYESMIKAVDQELINVIVDEVFA